MATFSFWCSWCWKPRTCQNFLLVWIAPLKTWLRWAAWWRETGLNVLPQPRKRCHALLLIKVRGRPLVDLIWTSIPAGIAICLLFFSMATLVALAKKQCGCVYNEGSLRITSKEQMHCHYSTCWTQTHASFRKCTSEHFPSLRSLVFPQLLVYNDFFFPFLSASRWPWSTARGHA